VGVAIAPDRLRLVFESDRVLKASIAHPTESGDPLSIDLGHLATTDALASLPGKIADNPFLTTIRLHREGNNTRLELVTPSAVTPQIFHVDPVNGRGDRLVVEIVPDILPTAPPTEVTAAPVSASPAARWLRQLRSVRRSWRPWIVKRQRPRGDRGVRPLGKRFQHVAHS
jgi:hypothetical protein